MIEVIFTVDYEIYGNGEGSLKEAAFEPAEKLYSLFARRKARFVIFAEVAELEIIEANAADADIGLIKSQLRRFYKEGVEFGLHIHPWWYGAHIENRKWLLDYDSYNLCTQPRERIDQILDRSLAYYRILLGSPSFVPICFRAGHLLFQPTQPLSRALVERGIRLDSSFYKGGLWQQYKQDYRIGPLNSPYWRFTDDVTISEPEGALVEIPIYTQMTPIWRLFTSKRVNQQHASLTAKRTWRKIRTRVQDFMRFYYPQKFDVGQMTRDEMIRMMDRIIHYDEKNPLMYHPIVVIMHTKDPIDFAGMDALISRISEAQITISTFSDALRKIRGLQNNKESGQNLI